MDIIIDGYNVIFKISELGYTTEKCDIEVLRNRLLTLLEQYKEKRKHKLIVVFDGQGNGNSSGMRAAGIDVVFSRQGLDADEEIKRMVSASVNPRHITVITSDRDIEQYVKKYGSKVVGPLAFYRDIKKKVAHLQVAGQEERRFKKNEDDEPISKYLGPSRSEAQYWLRIFSEETGKRTDD
ncbi:RNA-binding protein [Candidatus Scalindua japonica]|uniref:RNA-binding protein n=1 Tax=Candidatus Scalindua japonica TaxID=1284222 RepID=A0A286TVS0_9BACT|nr:NYN domain-containing protein [Candidatus Scalindua japonica]GAX59934.1 RNA-binding protein [Candidatus Scalindua japonica]